MHYAYIKLNISPLCICKCVYVYIHIRSCVHIIACISIYNIENAHIHVDIYKNMCMYIYIYINTHHT